MGYQNSHYLNTKRGIYYYTRRVPKGLQERFQSSRFVKCLHKRSQTKAFRLSQELSSRLENIWDRMRLECLILKQMSRDSWFSAHPSCTRYTTDCWCRQLVAWCETCFPLTVTKAKSPRQSQRLGPSFTDHCRSPNWPRPRGWPIILSWSF